MYLVLYRVVKCVGVCVYVRARARHALRMLWSFISTVLCRNRHEHLCLMLHLSICRVPLPTTYYVPFLTTFYTLQTAIQEPRQVSGVPIGHCYRFVRRLEQTAGLRRQAEAAPAHEHHQRQQHGGRAAGLPGAIREPEISR